MKETNTKNRKGFTLAEALLATVVLGIAAAGVLLPFTAGAAARAEGVHRTLAAKLAADLMEEIINTPFNQIMSSFDGYSELQGQVKDTNGAGAVFTDEIYAGFNREVSCTQDAQFICATVRVFYNGGEIAIISRLISQ